MVMKTLREMMDLIEAAQRPHQSNTKNPVDFPRTWHDVDPKLGKQVDQMSQIEKVKKGFAHPDTLKTQGVAEAFDSQGYHTSVSKGKYLPSEYGQDENNLYLHDMMNSAHDGSGPKLVTIDDKRIATEVAAMFGGYVEKTPMRTYRIYRPRGATQSAKTPELTGVAEEQVEESSPDALSKIDELFRK